MNFPDLFDNGPFIDPPPCPPAILVGLCGIVDGSEISVSGLFGIPSNVGVATIIQNPATWTLSEAEVEVGIVAASGFGAAPNDLRARFGMFARYDANDSSDCEATFNEVLISLQAP